MERFASCSFKDFHSVEELYRSAAGVVYKGVFKYDSKPYVLKERKLAELGRRKDIMNEVKLLQQLRHTNVIQCEGWFRGGRDEESLYIVLEYMDGGDLQQLINSYRKADKRLREADIWHIFHQICQGLCHLHENGIIHRDIKALNIFTNAQQTVFKIGDLGVSRQLSEYTEMLNTFYGTPLYLSPELIENKAYNEKTDIWSLGILLYELCTLEPPFKANTLLGLAKLVLQGEYAPISSRYSVNMNKCIRWLLTKDFHKRPHIAQVLQFLSDKIGIQNTQEEMDDDSLDGGQPVRRDRSQARADPDRGPEAGPGQSGRGGDTDSEPDEPLPKVPEVRRSVERAAIQPLPSPEKPADKASKPKAMAVRIQENPLDNIMVQVDVSRVHAKLRKENILYRRLLQMRNFVTGMEGNSDSQKAQYTALEGSIISAMKNIGLLDDSLLTGKMKSVDAIRLDVKAADVVPSAQPLEDVPGKHVEIADNLPVYLQSSPKKDKQLPAGYRPRTAGNVRQDLPSDLPAYLEKEQRKPARVQEELFRKPLIPAATATTAAAPAGAVGSSSPDRRRPASAHPRRPASDEEPAYFQVRVHKDSKLRAAAAVDDGSAGLLLPSMQSKGKDIVNRRCNDQRMDMRRPQTAKERRPEVIAAPSPPAPAPIPVAVEEPAPERWLLPDKHRYYGHGRVNTDITPKAVPENHFNDPQDEGRKRESKSYKVVRDHQTKGFNIISNI